MSGTSISFGADGIFESAATANTFCAYDASVDRTTIVYQDTDNSNVGTVVNGAVSGTSISFTTPVTFTSGTTTYTSCAYDSNAEKVVGACFDATNGKAVVFSGGSSTLTSTNLLGIAAGAISDTTTGTINTWGSRNEVQTSLTIGSDYYVQGDGTITTTSTSPAQLIGTAISATQINIKDYTG